MINGFKTIGVYIKQKQQQNQKKNKLSYYFFEVFLSVTT